MIVVFLYQTIIGKHKNSQPDKLFILLYLIAQ